MRLVPHVAQTIEVDYPPQSGEAVGRVDISRLAFTAGYAAVTGYLGDKGIYHKEVKDRLLSLRSHEERVQRVAEKAANRVRYDASLVFELPSPVDLAT